MWSFVQEKITTRIPPSSLVLSSFQATIVCYFPSWLQDHSGVSNPFASLRHTGRRRAVLGHTLNTLQHVVTKRSHNVSSKFMILCWAAYTTLLGCMQPMGCRLDTLTDSSAWTAPGKPKYCTHVLLFFPSVGGATEQYWPQCTTVNR